jgi:hypothetical protein
MSPSWGARTLHSLHTGQKWLHTHMASRWTHPPSCLFSPPQASSSKSPPSLPQSGAATWHSVPMQPLLLLIPQPGTKRHIPHRSHPCPNMGPPSSMCRGLSISGPKPTVLMKPCRIIQNKVGSPTLCLQSPGQQSIKPLGNSTPWLASHSLQGAPTLTTPHWTLALPMAPKQGLSFTFQDRAWLRAKKAYRGFRMGSPTQLIHIFPSTLLPNLEGHMMLSPAAALVSPGCSAESTGPKVLEGWELGAKLVGGTPGAPGKFVSPRDPGIFH